MAISSELLARFDGLFKDFYNPEMLKTLPEHNELYKRIKKLSSVKWEGRKGVFALHTQRNHGMGFRGVNDTVPYAGFQGVTQGALAYTSFYSAIELHDEEIMRVKTDRGGFKKTLDLETKGVVRDVMTRFGTYVYMFPAQAQSKPIPTATALTQYATGIGIASAIGGGYGSLNAVMAFVDGAPSVAGGVATINVKWPLGYADPSGQSIGGARYLEKGQVLAWGTLSELNSGATLGFGEITGIDYSAQQITVAVRGAIPHNPAANDALVLASTPDNQLLSGHEYDKGINGLGTLYSFVQDGNYSTAGANYLSRFCDVETTPGGDYVWRPLIKQSGGQWNEQEVHEVIQQVEEIGNGRTNLLVSHHSVQREYIADIQASTMYQPEKVNGGYKTLQFSSGRELDWLADAKCPYGTIFCLDTEALGWATKDDWHWDEKGGVLKSLLTGGTGGQDKVRGIYKWRGNMGIEALNKHAVIHGINVSGTVK